MKKISSSNNILITIVAVAAISSLLCFIDENTVMQMVFLAIEFGAAGIFIGRATATVKKPVQNTNVNNEEAEMTEEIEPPRPKLAKLVKEHRRILSKIKTLQFALEKEHSYHYFSHDEQIIILTRDDADNHICYHITDLNGNAISKTGYLDERTLVPELSADIIETAIEKKLELLKKKLAILAEEISEFTITDVELPEEDEGIPDDVTEAAESIKETVVGVLLAVMNASEDTYVNIND